MTCANALVTVEVTVAYVLRRRHKQQTSATTGGGASNRVELTPVPDAATIGLPAAIAPHDEIAAQLVGPTKPVVRKKIGVATPIHIEDCIELLDGRGPQPGRLQA